MGKLHQVINQIFDLTLARVRRSPNRIMLTSIYR